MAERFLGPPINEAGCRFEFDGRTWSSFNREANENSATAVALPNSTNPNEPGGSMMHSEVHVFYQESQVNDWLREPGNRNAKVKVVFPTPPEPGKNPQPVFIVKAKRVS